MAVSAAPPSVFLAFAFFLVHMLLRINATKINNDVAGEPQVSCTEDSVTFSVRTQNRFAGNIFIKGKYNVPQCRQEYFSNSFNGASFTVRIGDCGMRRIRQLQPHGMNYILVFVVNFHNQFITKVDRAYNVRCFYAQIDKTVTSQLGVRCPVFTPVIQGNLNYDNTLNLAYVEVWAYKFPDRSQLFFQCQIQVCNKRENECIGVTPPNCPLISGGNPNIGVIGGPGGVINPGGINPGVINPGGFPGGINPGGIGVINPGIVNPGGQTGGYIGSGSVNVPNPLPNIGVNSIYPQQGIGIGVQGPSSSYSFPNPSPPVINPGFGPGIGIGVNQGSGGYRRREEDGGLARNAIDEPARPALGDTALRNTNGIPLHGPIQPAQIEEQPAIGDQLPSDSLNIAGGQSFPQGFRAGPLDPIKRSKVRRDVRLPEEAVDIVVDDNTLDVASETVFVADVEQEAPELDDEAEAFAQELNHEMDDSMVCLSPVSMGCLVSTFMMMMLIILVLVIFICRKTSAKIATATGPSIPSDYNGFLTAPLTKIREHFILT